MKFQVLLFGLMASLPAWAAATDYDLVDVCGTIEHGKGSSTITGFDRGRPNDPEQTYTVVPSEDPDNSMDMEFMQSRVKSGSRICIRGFKKDEKTIWLFDFFGFRREETIISCDVRHVVDENVYEEGLSKGEYPNVSVMRYSESDDVKENGLDVSIGANRNYVESRGDKIQVSRSADRVSVTAEYADEPGYKVKITRTNQKRSGHYIGYLDVDGELVAYLNCK